MGRMRHATLVVIENAHHEFGKHLDRLVTMFEVADVQIDRLDSL